MNCLFCDFKLEKSEKTWTGLECIRHSLIEVMFFPDEDDLNLLAYYTMKKDELEICVYVDSPPKNYNDHVFFISKYENNKFINLFKSTKIPLITPDNFLNKMKTILTFL